MSISVTVRGNPININKGNLLLCDIDQLRTNEINRRRKLRIQQVRQQSKDIANMIRERVRDEAARQLAIFGHHQIAELKKLQSEKIRSLQQQYQDCLQEIGAGHQQAALQPDAELELARQREINQAIAQERGQEAAMKLKLEKDAAEEQKKAEKKLHKYSRTVENLRSAMIVSLGSKPLKKTKSPKERPHKKVPLQELPTNILPLPKEPHESKQIKVTVKPHCRFCNKPDCVCTCAKEYSKRLRQPLPAEGERKGSSTYSPILPSNIPSSPIAKDIQPTEVFSHLPEEQTSCMIDKGSEISSELTDNKSHADYSEVPLPHHKLWGFPVSEKTKVGTSDSQSSGMKDYDEPHTIHLKNDEVVEEGYDSSSTSDTSSTCTCFAEPCLCSELRGLSSRRRKVQLYDHGNRYHSECYSYPRVERNLYNNSEPDALKAAEMQEVPSTDPRNAQEALKRVRGNQALMREKISRDYKEMLVKLSSLAREERLARSDPVNCLPEEAYLSESRQKEVINKRQKHMDAVFENAFSDVILQKSPDLHSVPEPEAAKLPSSEVEESPLKLNMAQCKKISPTKPVSPVEEMLIKNTGEIEHLERPNASKTSPLEDLMKRVNMQRTLLLEELGVSTAPPFESQNIHSTETATQGSKPEQILQSIHESLLASLSTVSLGSLDSLPNACDEPVSGRGKEDTEIPSPKKTSYDDHIRVSASAKDPSKKDTEEERKLKNVSETKHHKKRIGRRTQLEEQLEDKDKKNSSSSSSITLVNEYSIDMSRSRTIEHSFDNGVESFNSSTSAYEEVKIVVSVTERAEQTPPKSPSKKQKQKSSGITASPRKTQKQQLHPLPTKRMQKTHGEKCKTSILKTAIPDISKTLGRKHPVHKKPIRSKEKRTKDATIQTYNESNQDLSTTWVERLRKSNSSISSKYESDFSSFINPPEPVCTDKHGEINTQPEVPRAAESQSKNPILSCYISRLLAMSRKSIENLHVSSSEVSLSSLKDMKINAAIQTEGVVNDSGKENEDQRPCCKAETIDSDGTRRNAEDDRTKMLHEKVQFPHYSEDFKSLHASSSSSVTTPELYPSPRRGGKETIDRTQLAQHEHASSPSQVHYKDESKLIQEAKATYKEKLISQEGRHQGLTAEGLISTSPSNVVDTPMDEQEYGRYPQLLDNMTETCLRNISKLNKSIERVRMEQKKLIEMSLSGSGSSSNSNGNDNNRSNNSTRYRSPPPKSRIMAPARPREVSKSPKEEMAPTIVTSTPNTSVKAQHLASSEDKSTNKTDSVRRTYQSVNQSAQTWPETVSRNGNAGFARNLSTIFEVDSSVSSQHRESRRNSDRSPSSREKEKFIQRAQSINTESDNESLPDVMAEMLRRGLISSPLIWSKTSAQDTLEPDQKISISSSAEPEKSNINSTTKDGGDLQNSAPRILQAVTQMGLNPTPEDKKAFYNSFGIEWEEVASCFESDSGKPDTSSVLNKRAPQKQPVTLKKNSHKQPSHSEIKVSLREYRSADSSRETSPAHSDLVEIICNKCNSIMVKCTCDLLPDIPSSENLTSDSGF